MIWDKSYGPCTFLGKGAVDMDSPPAIGDRVTLQKSGFSFEVLLTAAAFAHLCGTIECIGPEPAVEALGIKCGDRVVFQSCNVFTVTRA